jgi:hypothetical protein
MKKLGPKQQKSLITGNESWIFWNNNPRGMWAQDREDALANAKKIISSNKTMFSAYFSHIGSVSIDSLAQGQKYNSQFVPETLLPSLVATLSVSHPKLKAIAAHLHIDNAKPQNSPLSI